MTNDDGVVDFLVVEKCNHIADQFGHGVGRHSLGLITPSIPPLVGSDDLVTSVSQHRNLMTP